MSEIHWPLSLWICPNGHVFVESGAGRCTTCRRQLGLVHVERYGRVVELQNALTATFEKFYDKRDPDWNKHLEAYSHALRVDEKGKDHDG